jgi:hypothetical protein
MNNKIQKVTALALGIVGSQVMCKAAGTTSGSENNLNSLALVIAVGSLAISSIALAFSFYIKKRNTVDLVNTTEDILLSMDSLKTTLGKDIKNIRKEINRNNRRENPKTFHSHGEKAIISGQDGENPVIKPAPNRKVPHKKHYSRGRSFVKPKTNEEGENSIE